VACIYKFETTIVRLKSTREVLSISSFFASPKKDQKKAFDSSKAVRATRQSRSNAIQEVWQATNVNALNALLCRSVCSLILTSLLESDLRS